MAGSKHRQYKILKENTRALGDYSLRFIQDSDIESIRIWRNNQMSVLRQRSAITPEDQKNYYNKIIWPDMDKDQPQQILFALEHQGALIGYGGLVHISWPDKRAEISFLVSPERAAKAEIYESDMIHFFRLIQEVGFKELYFDKLFTETYESRKAHMQILEKSGLKLEACLKKHVLINSERQDSLFHAVHR